MPGALWESTHRTSTRTREVVWLDRGTQRGDWPSLVGPFKPKAYQIYVLLFPGHCSHTPVVVLVSVRSGWLPGCFPNPRRWREQTSVLCAGLSQVPSQPLWSGRWWHPAGLLGHGQGPLPTAFLELPSSSSMPAGPKASQSHLNIPWKSDWWCLRAGWKASDSFVPPATVCLSGFLFLLAQIRG